MKLAIIAITAFFGALIGGASGSALLTHPEWFGLSRTSAVPEAEAADRNRRADRDQQGAGITCEHAPKDFAGIFASETDCFFIQRIFRLALETALEGASPATWRNPRTGSLGTTRILGSVPASDGAVCRRFQQTATVNGRIHSATGKACYRKNAWQIET